RCSAHAPVTTRQHLCRPGRWRIALADADEEPGDVAHHVVQEGIASGLDREPVALPRDGEALHAADRRFRLTFGGAKGAEVMLPLERRGRLRHALRIERTVNPGCARGQESRSRGTIEYEIAVGA